MRPATAVRAARKFRGLTQNQLAEAVKVTPSTIYRLEAGDDRIETDTLIRIAARLAVTFDVATNEFELPTEIPAGFLRENQSERRGRGIKRNAEPPDGDKMTLEHLPIPQAVYPWPIAAGGWSELKGIYQVAAQREVPFAVRISGDSMEPKCKDGDCVAFRPINLNESPPQVGQDYLIVRTPDEGTFKRLVSIDGEVLVLQALNIKKYPKSLTVSLQEIVMIAEARFLVKDFPKV